MIDETYITSFVALHEIDALEPSSSGQTAKIDNNDLFFMSHIVAENSADQPAQLVSKKIAYKNFAKTLSSDFGLSAMSTMSDDIANMSSIVSDSIDSLSDAMSNVSNELSNAISTSINGLSDVYVHKSESEGSTDIILGNGTDMHSIAKTIKYKDGVLTATDHLPLTSLLNIGDLRLVNGGVSTSCLTSTRIEVPNTGWYSSISYELSNDCYVNVQISSVEGAAASPMQVYLVGNGTSALMGQSTPAGGYARAVVTSYFSTGFLTKSHELSDPSTALSIRVQHLHTTDRIMPGTTIEVKEMTLYAVPAADELTAYARVPSDLQADIRHAQLSVMKLALNSQGMTVSAEPVPYQYATSDQFGYVKLPSPNAVHSDQHLYPLQLSGGEDAYAYVPYADASNAGVLKTGFETRDSRGSVSCSISVDSSGNGYAAIPCASDATAGTMRCRYAQAYSSNGLSAAVKCSISGDAFAFVPIAKTDIPGVVAVGVKDATVLDAIRSVYVDNEQGKCIAKVNVMTDGSIEAQRFFSQKSGIDIYETMQLDSASAEPVESYEKARTIADDAEIEKSSFGQWKWTAEFPDVSSQNAAVFASYNGHSDIDPECGVQIIVNGIATAAFFPHGCKTSSSGQWTDTKFLGTFSKPDDGNFTIEVVTDGKDGFKNGNKIDSMTFVVRDLMRQSS